MRWLLTFLLVVLIPVAASAQDCPDGTPEGTSPPGNACQLCRAGALEFLRTVKTRDTRVLLVTNSHPETLALKDAVTGLGDYFDGVFSSHNYGHAKESQAFWHALQDDAGFDIETTLFVDDSQPVLQSAKEYGISMLVTVTRPDTSRPVKRGSEFRGVETVGDMLS